MSLKPVCQLLLELCVCVLGPGQDRAVSAHWSLPGKFCNLLLEFAALKFLSHGMKFFVSALVCICRKDLNTFC